MAYVDLDRSYGDHLYSLQGLGYGVVLTGGGDGNVTVIVENNRFDYNRHTVAGSGERGKLLRNNGNRSRKLL